MLQRSQFRNDNFFLFFGDCGDRRHFVTLAGKQRRHGSDQEDNSSKEEGNSDGHQINNAEKGSKDEGPPQPAGFWGPCFGHVRKRTFMKRTATSTFASVAGLN